MRGVDAPYTYAYRRRISVAREQESSNENLAAQLMGRPPGKPDTRIVLQESLWPLREFIYVNLSECHFHRVGVGYCECSDFAAAFTEFENLAIPAD